MSARIHHTVTPDKPMQSFNAWAAYIRSCTMINVIRDNQKNQVYQEVQRIMAKR